MMLFVDRMESGLAVCETEDGEFLTISSAVLPHGVREGSVLEQDERGGWRLNPEAEERRRQELFARQEDLFDE